MTTDPALFPVDPAPVPTPGLFDDVPDLAVTTSVAKVTREVVDTPRPTVQHSLFDLALVATDDGRFGLVIDD